MKWKCEKWKNLLTENPAEQTRTLATTHWTEDQLLSLKVTQMSGSYGSLLLPRNEGVTQL